MALARVNVSSGGGSKTPKLVSVPVQSGTLTYIGSARTPTWSGYDSTQLTIGGTTSATNAGTYTATFTPKSGYTWTDGTSNPKNATWTIAKGTNPTLHTSITDSSLVYGDTSTINITTNTSGGTITATSSNTSAVIVQSVTNSAITLKCVGVSSTSTTITITAAETTNYLSKTVTRTVTTAKAEGSITLSATEGTITYGTPLTFTVTGNTSGGELSVKPAISEYTTASISGNVVTVNYVAYSSSRQTITVTSEETANYKKATAKFYATLERATCTLSLSANSGTVTKAGYAIFTVTTPSDGKLSVTSSDTDIATAKIEGNTVTVAGKASDGSATITVSQKQTNNYAAPESKNYVVQCRETKAITDSWATISTRSKNGTAYNYYNIGDYKEITLNGKIGDCLELTNEKLRVFILHINHPMDGIPDNNIIWSGFQTADSVNVALCDSKYGSNSSYGTICFNMNHWGGSNSGGWKGTDLRYDILGATSTPPSDYGALHTESNVGYNATDATLKSPKPNTLLAALPADFRNALRLWSYQSTVAYDEDNNAIKEEVIDAVSLLLKSFDVSIYQTRYKHSDPSSKATYWRSVMCSPRSWIDCFLCYDNIAETAESVRSSNALAPAFKT